MYYRQPRFDPNAALLERGGHRHDAGRAKVHYRAEDHPLEGLFQAPAGQDSDAASFREEKRLRESGHQEGEDHADGDQLEIGYREIPPALQQRRLQLTLDAEALEALDDGSRYDIQVLADCVELWEPV